MVTDFQDRLRQIREAKDRELRQQREARSTADQDRFTRMVLRFVHREKIERIIADLCDNFMQEVPSFRLSKSFFEAKYKIEIHTDDLLIGEGGRVDKFFSRITFLLDTKPGTQGLGDEALGRLQVRCKKTVRNRDLESAMVEVDCSPESVSAFRQFAQEQFLEFAGEYFSSLHRAPTH